LSFGSKKARRSSSLGYGSRSAPCSSPAIHGAVPWDAYSIVHAARSRCGSP
jgi:hypothetical protein